MSRKAKKVGWTNLLLFQARYESGKGEKVIW